MIHPKHRVATLLLALSLPLALGACVSTAKTVVTAPFKAVGKVADWSTTSQEEADRNRGRAMRERGQRLGKLHKAHGKASGRCAKGDARQCDRAEVLAHEIEAVTNSIY